MTTTTLTQEARWNLALTEAMVDHNIHIVENLEPDCRCCVDHTDIGLAQEDNDTPYAFTFGINGHGEVDGYEWMYGSPINHTQETIDNGDYDENDDYHEDIEVNDYYSPYAGAIEFRHGNGSTQGLIEAFTNHGFKVEWDGKDSSLVYVTP